MSCPTEHDLSLHADGELTINAAQDVVAHLAGCPNCRHKSERLASIADSMRRAYPTAAEAGFAADTMARIHASPARRRWGPALAAAAVLMVGVATLVAPKNDNTFVARGGLVPDDARRVGVDIRVDGELLLAGGTIAASSGFTFEVSNRTGRELELMIFAVDAAGDVHWFYPAYLDPATNPRSLTVPAHPAVVALDEGVRPDRPAPGALRLVTIFAERPLLVRAVEAAVAEDRLSAAFPDAIIRSEIHEVTP